MTGPEFELHDQDNHLIDEAPDTPPRVSPDAGNPHACDCHGAWHAMQDHCVTWPCPGCPGLCPPEPGVQED